MPRLNKVKSTQNMSPAYRAMLEDAAARRAKFLALYEGTGGGTGLTMEEIGERHGLTRARVQKLITKARADRVANAPRGTKAGT